MKTGIYWQDPKYALGQYRTDPSCVLYLPLHRLDGASFMSKDVYGHLCTVTGALWTPGGRRFDGGDDLIVCGGDASLKSASNTLELWARADALDPTDQKIAWRYMVNTNNRAYLAIPWGDGSVYMFAAINGSSGFHFQGLYTLADLDWHCYVCVLDGTDWSFYVDGEYKGSESTDDWADMQGIPTFQISEASAYGFDGLIDEVRIYNRALTPLEIQHSYLASKWRYQ